MKLLCRLISRALALALSRRPDTAALVRTTLATTRMAAGVADNVLPQTGILTFNARHLPGTNHHDRSSSQLTAAHHSAGHPSKVYLIVLPPSLLPLVQVKGQTSSRNTF